MPSGDRLPNSKEYKMKKIAVIIPSYNNHQWYERNLASVVAQDYQSFRVVYVDDCSSDETGALVKQFIADTHSESLIRLICNSVRLGALQNIYNTVHSCDDEEIVILLDGDDWFAHNGVLTKVDEAYTNPDCWMTYGQYRSWPDNTVGEYSREIPANVIEANSFREIEWCASHLRSFYARLFKLIRVEDLGPCGTFYQMAWDQAIMFPMLEMSGYRAKFISEVLYIYNAANQLNDSKINRELQRSLETAIRTQKRYNRLDRRGLRIEHHTGRSRGCD
jgi:glycosyltransferase involved in cell wall biosynthesis